MPATERVKLSLGEAVAWALLHERSDRLAPFAVLHACHRHARNAGMRVKDVLNLARIDVLPPRMIMSLRRPWMRQ